MKDDPTARSPQQYRVKPATLPPAENSEQLTLPAAPAVSADARTPEGYVIERELGRGGMGVVYLARSLALQRTCALKMILAGAHSGDGEIDRFRTEAQAIARLQHPGIVQVFEIGEHDGRPFMALEYCSAGSLDAVLAKNPLPLRQAAGLLRKLAEAMQAAHEAQVIHRDLKPANVLLTDRGDPKVTDFGLARKLDEQGATRTGSVIGTPSYMPPEQAGGSKSIGSTADVYALGAILYECLTGRPPFRAATPLDTLLLVLSDEPVPLRQLNRQTPVDLETIAHKCLQKDPRKRYATAQELADDLGRSLNGEPIRARPVGVIERGVKWVRRNRTVSALTAALMVGVLVSGYFAYASDRRAKAEAEAKELAQQEKTRADEQTRRAVDEKTRADEQLRLAEWAVYSGKLQLAQSAFADNNVPLAFNYLDECQWDLHGWEHRHLRWRFDGSKQTLRGHTREVSSVAFSPDGQRIVTGSRDRTAKVWDATKGTELLSLKGHTSYMDSVAFSPDGQRVFAWDGSGEVLAWDTSTGKPVATDNPPLRPASRSATSPNGRLSAKPDGDTVSVVDLSQPAPEGSPWPLPDRSERVRHHSEQVVLAGKDKQWFAVAFHLGRLLLDDPDNPDLKRRRDEALKNHAATSSGPPTMEKVP